MNKRIDIFFLLVVTTSLFFRCTTSKKQTTVSYCGEKINNIEMSSMRINSEYEYSDEDLSLLSELTTEVQSIFNDSIEIELFFFGTNDNKIGIYIISSNVKKQVKELSKFFCETKLKEKLSRHKYLLFYNTNSDELVEGLKRF